MLSNIEDDVLQVNYLSVSCIIVYLNLTSSKRQLEILLDYILLMSVNAEALLLIIGEFYKY